MPLTNPIPPRYRLPLRRAAWVLLALYAIYLVTANVFLNTSLGDAAVNRQPERFHAQWSWAASLYPGHVHARALVVGGHARTTMWEASAALADGRIRVLPLLARRLSFGAIVANDVTFDSDRVAGDLLPPPRTSRPWRIDASAIDTASLRRLRYGSAVLTGEGRARFAFDKALRGGPFEVRPSWLRVDGATARVGGRTLSRALDVDFDLVMAPHTRDQAAGLDKVGVADARLVMAGSTVGVDLREDGAGHVAAAAGAHGGRIVADLALRRGVLQPGGVATWTAPLRVVTGATDATPRFHALVVAVAVGDDGVAATARVPPRVGSDDRLDARFALAERRLLALADAEALDGLSGAVDAHWRVPSLRVLDRLLGDAAWLRLEGAATVDAALQVRGGALADGSRARISDARMRATVFDSVFAGDVRADATVADGATRVDLVADRFTLAPTDAPGADDVRGDDLRLDLRASGPLSAFADTLEASLRFSDARIPDLRTYNRYLPGDSLRFLGGSGTLGGELALDAAGRVGSGRIALRGDRARIRLGATTLTGDLQLDTRLQEARRTGTRYRLDGFALSLDNVHVGDDTDDAGWWARFDLDNASLDWRPPFVVEGDARLRMQDASVLLLLFAERSAFPAWIARIVDAGETEATGRLHVAGATLVLDAIEARNDRVALDARLKVVGGTPSGDLYARWGVLGVGVELAGGERQLRVAGAREWYESRPPLLPARPTP